MLIFSHYYHSGCWAAGSNNKDQWIGVEFNQTFEISAIQIQSRRNAGQWVKTYEITYSMDGENWNTYSNGDGDTVN